MDRFIRNTAVWIVWIMSLAVTTNGAERNIDIPSDSTGGGNLAVRVSYPDSPEDYRFSEGSPVIVISQGGHQPGNLNPGGPWTDFGFTIVTFLYPGGSDGPFASDGTYDYRGENCILALRDVIRYAMGLHLDIMGNTIQDLVPGIVLTSNTGIVASSNGGPTATATLGLFSADLQGISYIVYMESPTNDQTVNGDLGQVGLDCDLLFDGDGNGLPGDDGKNVRYTAYDTSSCVVDFTTLAWNASEIANYTDPAGVFPPVQIPGKLFLDNNLNGIPDYSGTPPCYDTNGNGQMDWDEDYPFSGKITFAGPGDVTVFLSTEVTSAADAMAIFPGPWPSHIASLADSESFWFYRDATHHFPGVSTAFPTIGILLVFTETDHVQCADDHPHIQQAYDGYRTGGVWCRLNPDISYIEYAAGGSAPYGTQDTAANIPVIPGLMKQYANPDGVNGLVAGACEMADRAHFNEWSLNLTGVLPMVTPTPMPTWTPAPADCPPLYIVSMMHAEESLPFHQDQTLFQNHADSLRALSALLASHGAKLDFGPDWTFIDGIKAFDPTLLTDILAAGHGVHTHAHESQFNLGQVNAKLLEAGLTDNHIANGGFLQTGPGGTNWVGYVADFNDNINNQLFTVSVGYKNPVTQTVDGSGFVFRPGVMGDWTIPDPDGPLIYIGCNMPDDEGAGAGLDFAEIRGWIDDVLTRIDPDKVNTLYWHDSLHHYGNSTTAQARMNEWENLLTEYLDPLAALGRVEWRNFTEIGDIYLDWEQDHNPCSETRVSINMPAEMFTAGDACWCRINVCNATDVDLEMHPLFVILDVYGNLYFAPSFGDFDSYLSEYPVFVSGMTTVDVLPLFFWPENAGSATDIYWHAAMTDPAITQIVGEWDSFAFGWTDHE